MKQYKSTILMLLLVSLISCKDDENIKINKYPDIEISDSIIDVNYFIKKTMEEVYLWETYIPNNLDYRKYTDPKIFFEKFVYEDDYWSWVSDDYYATEDLYSGVTTTSGCEYSLSLISDGYSVIGIVEYVLPGSPAEEVGIQRGDIFTKIDGTSLNYDNYYELLTQGGTYTMTLATISDNTLYEDTTVSITEAENFQENPIIVDTVFSIGGKKIGYLMYSSYLAEYIDEVDAVFARFKAEGVTDLVVDLRYNSGGSVAAEEAMANLIVPSSAIGEIFQKSVYNDLYNAYFTQNYGSAYLNTYFEASANSIDLSGQLIGLTGDYTASASEGLLNGLEPFTEMTLIGDTTYGKYTAMWVLPDDDEDPQWAIIPVVSKTTNANDVSVKGGMAPDILLADNPLDGYQLGDVNETFLAKAIEQITGDASTRSARVQPAFIGKSLGRFKDGKKVEAQDHIIGWGRDFLISE